VPEAISLENMKTKITVLILSIIYCGYLSIVLTANPLNSEYYYKRGLLTKAIEVEPSKAEYHMYYGLELLKTLPKDKFSAQIQLRLAKIEFSRAANLKPYSELYKTTCSTYAAWIDKQL